MSGGGLRIAHVVRSDAFAGVERYICGVANSLAGKGHEVHAVGGAAARMQQELGGSVDHVPAASSYGVASALARFGRLDVVHAHMTAAEVAAIVAHPVNRAPIVCTRHFPDARLGKLPVFVGSIVRVRLAAQIAISDFVATAIDGPSTVIHNGVPARPQADLDQPIVLMLQRLQPEKAPLDGIEAWARSKLGNAGWRLVIAGTGSLDSDARERSRELGVDPSVSFLGHVSDTDDILRSASVLLAPAPAEPFGLSVVEAMAFGIPVVAARGGAHLETLGPEGRFFEPGDTAAAAALLTELAADRELRSTVGRRLRARQESMYSLENHVSRLEELYRALLAEH